MVSHAGRTPYFQVNLTSSEMDLCKNTLNSRVCKTVQKRCNLLLGLINYEQGKLNYSQIGRAHCVNKNYPSAVAKMYCEGGLAGIMSLKRSPNSDLSNLRLDARAESFLVSMACTPPPYPHARWTVKLCTEELNKLMTEKGLSGNFSQSTVWRALRRNELQPHRSEYWCIPEVTADFVMHMETVLHLYSLPYDSSRPVICMDEAALQLIRDLDMRLETRPGNIGTKDWKILHLCY